MAVLHCVRFICGLDAVERTVFQHSGEIIAEILQTVRRMKYVTLYYVSPQR
jgi:hypothetical protein